MQSPFRAPLAAPRANQPPVAAASDAPEPAVAWMPVSAQSQSQASHAALRANQPPVAAESDATESDMAWTSAPAQSPYRPSQAAPLAKQRPATEPAPAGSLPHGEDPAGAVMPPERSQNARAQSTGLLPKRTAEAPETAVSPPSPADIWSPGDPSNNEAATVGDQPPQASEAAASAFAASAPPLSLVTAAATQPAGHGGAFQPARRRTAKERSPEAGQTVAATGAPQSSGQTAGASSAGVQPDAAIQPATPPAQSAGNSRWPAAGDQSAASPWAVAAPVNRPPILVAGHAAVSPGNAIRSAPEPLTASASPQSPGTAAQPAPQAAASSQPQQPFEVAFMATLKLPEDAPQPASPEAPRSAPAAAGPHLAEPSTPLAAAATATPPADNEAHPVEAASRPVASRDKSPDAGEGGGRKPGENAASEPGAAGASGLPARPPGTPEAPLPANPGPAERTTSAEAPAPAARPPAGPVPEPVKAAAAHDIKIQVGGQGEQRVEVRVTERGGDVHVAVRTPDSQLAGDLRDDLPSLAARLEQSGFHATTWQPAGDLQHLADPQAGTSAQDAQGQSRQNGSGEQRDPQERKPKDPENPDNPSQSKEQGKDFAWLLSSLR